MPVAGVDVLVREPLRAHVAQRPVERTGHVAHHLHGRVVHAVAAACFRIEGGEEVFVEVEDRVRPAVLRGQQRRREAVDRIVDDREADADGLHDLFLRQHAQRAAHERVFVGHRPPRVGVDVLARGLAHQEQAEGERLREGGREQRVEIAFGIAAGFRTRVKDLPEDVADLIERIAGTSRISQPVAHDAPHQARRMGEQRGHLLRVVRHRRMASALAQPAEETHEGRRIMGGDRAVRRRVARVGRHGVSGQDRRLAQEVGALVEAERVKVRDRPVAQSREALELAPVVPLPRGGVVRLVGCLQLHEGPRCRPRRDDRDVRTADATLGILARHRQPRKRGRGEKILRQLLKLRCQTEFAHLGIGSPPVANPLGVSLKRRRWVHCVVKAGGDVPPSWHGSGAMGISSRPIGYPQRSFMNGIMGSIRDRMGGP